MRFTAEFFNLSARFPMRYFEDFSDSTSTCASGFTSGNVLSLDFISHRVTFPGTRLTSACSSAPNSLLYARMKNLHGGKPSK